MRYLRYIIIFIIPAFFTLSCRKIETLPPEPKIEFISFSVFDTIDILNNSCKGGRLKFYFEDGDGNLGLPTPDELQAQADTINLFLTLYRKVNNVMVEVPEDDILKPSGYRIPYMEREGQNKILKGTISITFLYLFYLPEDTARLRYDFYLKDRADNISNTESTSEINLSVNDIYVKSD